MLAFDLCDRRGVPLRGLDRRRPGSTVTVALNGQRTARVALSLEETAAALVKPLATTIKAWLGPEQLLAGPVILPHFRSADRSVEIPAVDPSFYLQRAFIGQRSDGAGLTGNTNGLYRLENVDQTEIMWRLIEYALPTAAELASGIPSHGIIDGDRPASAQDDGWLLRTREYELGKQIWEANTQMAGVIAGPDFELAPLDRDDGVFAQLNAYGRQGTDRSETVIFEHGTGSGNAADVTYEPAGDLVANRGTVIGQVTVDTASPLYTANQAESQHQLGIIGAWQSDPDVIELGTVTDKAKGLVAARAFPPDVFTVTPAAEGGRGLVRDRSGQIVDVGSGYGVPPRIGPNGDYWIGDDITAITRVLPGLDVTLVGRVVEARLTEADEAGTVLTELTCEPRVVAASVT